MLFRLGERKRMEGRRGRENYVSRYWGRVMKKKENNEDLWGERGYTRVRCLGSGSGMSPTKIEIFE